MVILSVFFFMNQQVQLYLLGLCVSMVFCSLLLWHNRCPQWTDNEQLCARNVTNEVHCFRGGAPGIISVCVSAVGMKWGACLAPAGSSCDSKLQIAGLASYALSRGRPPYRIVVYIPGSKVGCADFFLFCDSGKESLIVWFHWLESSTWLKKCVDTYRELLPLCVCLNTPT